MNTRSGLTLPKLGLGCWPLGGDQWGPQNDRDSQMAILAAYEQGVTHFDTAQAYGRGHGEELLGGAVKPFRERVFLATKILYTFPQRVEAAVAFSLRRLQTDYIDLLYIHWPKKGGDLAGMMRELEKLRSRGVIRNIGVSNFSVADMQSVMQEGAIDAHQLCYNLLWRRGERETIPFCVQQGIALVAYSSLAEGILTGKFGQVVSFAKGDHRQHTVLFDQMIWPSVYDAVENLKKIAEQAGRPLGHLALRWLLSKQGVASVLAGSRNAEQVADNVQSLQGDIPQEIFDKMTAVSDELQKELPEERNIFRWDP
jgi:aryl-alcohol dehydrogenase-like predicted oxidoreductase